MEPRTIADEFFETKPELVAAIKSLEKKRNFSLFQRLLKEENAINFFSTLAEIRTGLFFDPLCSELRYNWPVGGQRPDWFLNLNDQSIICEVLRLNTTEEECIANIERNRQLRKFQINNPGVPIIEYGESKTIDTAFLSGAQSKLQYKEAKYRNIIEQNRMPFIICVNPSIQTYINEIDFNDFLMGRHGFFASDDYFGSSVTGVLLQGYFIGQWVYYPNHNAKYPLSDANEKIMANWIL